MTSRKTPKIPRTLLHWGLHGTAVCLLVWLWYRLDRKEEELKATREKQSALMEAHTRLNRQHQQEQKAWKLKSEADERFLANEPMAMEIYRQLDSISSRTGRLFPLRKTQWERRQYRTQQLSALRSLLKQQQQELMQSHTQRDSLAQSLHQVEVSWESAQQMTSQLQEKLQDSLHQLTALNRHLLENIRLAEFTSPKGSHVYYLGELSDGKAHGQGVGIWATGGIYIGQWLNNTRHGRGTYQWADGERYEGDFIHDRRTGSGTYYWKSGEYFIGQWLNDARQGPGKLYKPDGKLRVEGLWHKDELKRGVQVSN
ncbi:MAG: hypothetical protein KF690_05985 [Bacteroidetes bacterium]|nr:hypothetical protein [Bacteroidota bacterium]